MQHEFKGYRLTLIDEPLQSHVVGWEQASRAMKNEDAKPVLNEIMAELRKVNVTDRTPSLLPVFQLVFQGLEQALTIINNNETLTLSSNRGVMVKAAIKAGWIVSLEEIPDKDGESPVQIMKTVEEVDQISPPWLVSWVAEQVGTLYLEAVTIPKN